jgi:glycosyltransferase involved in cell wall biosynthesis
MANSGEGFGTVSSVVFRAAERLVGRWTDGYFTVGEDLRDRYIRARVAVPKRYHIVRSPIDFRRFLAAAERGRNAARQELGLDEGRSVIAYVGRLEERKGVRDLPNYLRAVCELVPVPPIFLIAGDGELRADLERTFEEAGTRNDVVFLGYSDSVPTVLAAADCLVLLSRAEGLPQVLVQAAATCTPFVSYPVDGAAELRLRGATGEVVPFGAWQAAAQATIRFLNAPRPESIDLTEWDAREVEKQFKSLFAQLTERCRYPQDVDGRQRAA